ncbi:MAG TPA: dihydrofolate reductase family protein [Jatrophihabitans sp.]
MRALLPIPADSVDVHERYAAHWLDTGGIRANMVCGVDGAAAADGRSAGLQTPGDNRVFHAQRDLADVILVGSATAETEGYGPAEPDLAVRTRWGLRPQLPIAVITRSLRVDTAGPLFVDNRPLVVTCASSDPARRAELGERADVLVCGGDDIDYGAARRALAERGLTRVLCEGGPTILSRLLVTGELDELCLSLTPRATGPGEARIVVGAPWPDGPRALTLTSLLEEDGALFLRYSTAHAAPVE